MPSLEDIRRFHDTLVSVGHEPQVLATRGETIEIPAAIPETIPKSVASTTTAESGVSDLLNDIAESDGTDETAGETVSDEELFAGLLGGAPAASDEDSPFDMDNVAFDDIGEGDIPGLETAEPVIADSATEASAETPDFDLETFDFDTADYSEPEAGESANLFDTADFDFDTPTEFPAGDEEPAPFDEEPPAVTASPEAPSEGMVFEAPGVPGAADSDESVFALPDIDESTFESGADFDSDTIGTIPEATDFGLISEPEGADFDEDAAPPFDFDDMSGFGEAEPIPAEAEEELPEVPEELSFDLDEDDLSGLDLGPPLASEQEDEFAVPIIEDSEDTAFAQPDEAELARQASIPDEEDEGFGDLDVDEFNLGDFGAEFGVLEHAGEEAQTEEDLNPALDITAAIPEQGGAPTAMLGELTLTEKQFAALKQTLSRLPLNLKIATEQIITDGKGSDEQQRKLIELLSGGATAQEVATLAGRILGKRIQVPRTYEKRTGVDFEAERRSFGYQFRVNILPILRVFVAGTLVLALIVFLGYRFIYRPIYAESLYRQGYNAISDLQSTRPNDFFSRAVAIWPVKSWFFNYATAFATHKHFILAEEKYDQLLRYYPHDRKATITYADFESIKRANYEKANGILQKYLNEKGNDADVLLAAGDNFMRWADEDPARYEDARRSYALIFQLYGPSDMLYMRMLRYFIRTDNQPEVLRLERYFQADKSAKIDPEVYAELGGYLLDKNMLQDVRDVLFRALKTNDRVPEVHFQLARYYQRVADPREEEKALTNARDLFNASEPLDRRQLAELIATYGRLGELDYSRGADIPAQEALAAGIRRYESAKQDSLLKPKPEFGKLYSTLGDIYYYKALDYTKALASYESALANKYSTPDLRYKVGYIHYRDGAYKTALSDFSGAAGVISTNRNLTYAMANAFYMRQDYYAAQGYLSDLLQRLRSEREQIQNLSVQSDPAQLSLIEFLIRSSNNMGVTMYRLWQRTGRQQDYTDALVYLKDSTEEATNLYRDPNSGVRSADIDLAYLNLRGIIYPDSSFTPQIYKEIPVDMQSKFLGASSH